MTLLVLTARTKISQIIILDKTAKLTKTQLDGTMTSDSKDCSLYPPAPPIFQLFHFSPRIITVLSAAADNTPHPPTCHLKSKDVITFCML